MSACTTTVLETRHGSHRRSLAGERTLVVADVAERFRGATEDAAVRELPGAVAAHRLPGAPTPSDLHSLVSSAWDSIVVFSVADADVKFTPALATVSGGAVVRLDLDVSVRSAADLKEIWGERMALKEADSHDSPLFAHVALRCRERNAR